MPSERRVLNVRLDDPTSAIWDELVPRVRAAVGLELSQAAVVALAIKALAEKYPAADSAPARPRPKR